MDNRKNLQKAVTYLAFGYVFLHVDVTIGVNLLPDWAGYLLLYLALPILAQEEPEAALLKPLALLIGGWGLFLWLAVPLGWELELPVIGVILNVLALYFHFQLLTNLASIAKTYQCPEAGKILHLRTGRTLLSTLAIIPIPWEIFQILLLAAYLVVVLWICWVLFSLRRSLGVESP